MAGTATQTATFTVKELDARFLCLAFSSIHIPPAVLPVVLDAYAHRFAFAFARNAHLTGGVAPLVELLVKTDDFDDLISLVRTNNPFVLDALLDTKDARDQIFRSIIETWVLSTSDQLRLVDRDFSLDTVSRILFSPDLTSEARIAAARRTNQHPDFINSLSVIPANDVLAPKKSYVRYHRPTVDEDQNPTIHLGKTISIFAGLHSITVISGILNDRLGDGSDPLSLASWMNFFGLCQDDPDVPLATVLSTARRLARAELTTVPVTVPLDTGNRCDPSPLASIRT
jgi:hypothetical protein